MNFNIKEELILRKKLENLTQWQIEFNQNYENRYDYDLKCYKHININSEVGFEKKLIGFVEVEHSPSWKDFEFPDRFDFTFLKRKVFEWNYTLNKWSKQPKKDYNKTVYVRVNNDYSNCISINCKDLYECKDEKVLNFGGRLNTFIVPTKKHITFGYKNTIDLILNLEN